MKSFEHTREIAVKVLENEAQAVLNLRNSINEDFYNAVSTIYKSKGRVILTGIGKSAQIAQKIVATLNSTGTPAIFMHAADAVHGDLGIVQRNDVVICISKSGNTSEIKVLVPLLKASGNKLIAIVGNTESWLAKQADFILNTTVESEACPLNLAPTTSTTAQLAMGDALAICLLQQKDFSSNDFAKFHPGGSLGKRLYLRVSDIFIHNQKPAVNINASVQDVIMEISTKRLGATAVLNNNKLAGMITDGDIRRMIVNGKIENIIAADIMSANPKTITPESLAINALQIMSENKITQLIVSENDNYLGMVHIHDLHREGII